MLFSPSNFSQAWRRSVFSRSIGTSDPGHGTSDGIAAKGSADNLWISMIGRLRRLPGAAQEALKLLACLGNQADFSTFAKLHGGSEDGVPSASDLWPPDARMHGSFRAAVEAGAIISHEGKYRFLHDRVQEAAYTLIPAKSRARLHLRIGRLLAGRPPEKIAEKIFDIVNQLNSGLAAHFGLARKGARRRAQSCRREGRPKPLLPMPSACHLSCGRHGRSVRRSVAELLRLEVWDCISNVPNARSSARTSSWPQRSSRNCCLRHSSKIDRAEALSSADASRVEARRLRTGSPDSTRMSANVQLGTAGAPDAGTGTGGV